jgi:N-methylhydantoinase A/oxoprolinase/acetone carboxylase beta subunit
MIRIGVDVGGTHTDLVMVDDSTGRVTLAKLPTTNSDPAEGTLAGVRELCEAARCALSDVGYFGHGTTVATNIVLEHNGAEVGLLTTHGFRDIIHIARHKRPLNFSLQQDLPWQKHPLVKRRNRLTLNERIAGPRGEVLLPLDEDEVRAKVRELRAAKVEAVAVCLLFSFLNPAHEKRVADIVREEFPEAFLSVSHEVMPQYREFERFSTACLNAYVGPKTGRYLTNLENALKRGGMKGGLHLMQSAGGSATLNGALARPVTLLMSGPVAGLIGGVHEGRLAGFDSVITLDVGGTSADIGVAPAGGMRMKHLLETRVGAYQAMVPMADVDTIGAGGGSIAYIDAGGSFRVGPRSAGANPGPACYGRGGAEPASTDCQIVLGRIDPDNFLGGRMRLDPEKSRAAIAEKLAAPLKVSVEDAAFGALKILTQSMVQSIENNSVRKGFDPRDFALVAFGGGGPLFACDIARELSIPTVVIPPNPGLTSALGLLVADLSYDFGRTELARASTLDHARIGRHFAELEAEARAQLKADKVPAGEMRFLRFADCRYLGQGYEIRTPVPAGRIGPDLGQAIASAFHAAHDREFGRSFAEKDVVIVNIRVVGVGATAKPRAAKLGKGTPKPPAAALRKTAKVAFATRTGWKWFKTPHYARALLKAGNRIAGPAIVQQTDSTTPIPPGLIATVQPNGALVIPIKDGEE